MMAAQEYDGMKEQLDLEQSLRVKAETYAHEVISEGLWRDFATGSDTRPALVLMADGCFNPLINEMSRIY